MSRRPWRREGKASLGYDLRHGVNPDLDRPIVPPNNLFATALLPERHPNPSGNEATGMPYTSSGMDATDSQYDLPPLTDLLLALLVALCLVVEILFADPPSTQY